MRFPKIETFNIDDLDLDESNPRFGVAPDQAGCINAIASSADSFKKLMRSVAIDDLGEPLLVLKRGKKRIIMDGNRRAAALKVLYQPDSMAPSKPIATLAKSLSPQCVVDFTSIQAQVSEDAALIARTVYERHSAGGGISRVDWSALAAARFGFHHHSDEAKDWRAMVLLHEVEQKKSKWLSFINSNQYSHDVFRRVIRGASALSIINSGLFHEGNQRLSKRPPAGSYDTAMKVAEQALSWMKAGTLNLSRKGGTFADSDRVESMLRAVFFPGSADVGNTSEKSGDASSNDDGEPTSAPDTTATDRGENNDAATNNDLPAQPPAQRSPSHLLPPSEAILSALRGNDLPKLNALYRSLTVISLNTNAILLWVGAWAFLETLGASKSGHVQDNFGWLRNKAKDFAAGNRGLKKDLSQAIDDIQSEGDCNKHSSEYYSVSALKLKPIFRTLEPFIVHVLKLPDPTR